MSGYGDQPDRDGAASSSSQPPPGQAHGGGYSRQFSNQDGGGFQSAEVQTQHLFDFFRAIIITVDVDTVNRLLRNNLVDINTVTPENWGFHTNGYTALHQAVDLDRLQILDALLAQPDLDLNITDHNLQTALYIAVDRGHFSAIEKLIADPRCQVEDCFLAPKPQKSRRNS